MQFPSKPETFLPLTETTFCILAALSVPRHGYGIMQVVERRSDGSVRLGPGTLYGALTNLMKQGLIARFGDSLEGGERKKLYLLTELGSQVVRLENERLTRLAAIGNRLLMEDRNDEGRN